MALKKLPLLENGDIVITIPASTSMDVYKQEIAKAEAGEVMNYQVNRLPISAKVGDKCYVCYNKQIIGWMKITNLATNKAFTCTTTGRQMSGNFIERSGKFHWLETPIPCEPFRGFRYASKLNLGL